jgi:hypothetical protein
MHVFWTWQARLKLNESHAAIRAAEEALISLEQLTWWQEGGQAGGEESAADARTRETARRASATAHALIIAERLNQARATERDGAALSHRQDATTADLVSAAEAAQAQYAAAEAAARQLRRSPELIGALVEANQQSVREAEALIAQGLASTRGVLASLSERQRNVSPQKSSPKRHRRTSQVRSAPDEL